MEQSKIESEEHVNGEENKIIRMLLQKIIRTLLKYAPTILFGLWAVLLWAIYAAPVMKGDGFFINNVNVYGILKDEMMSDLLHVAQALISFAALSCVYAAILTIIQRKCNNRVKSIASIVSHVFHVVILVCTIVLAVQFNKFVEGVDGMSGSFVAVSLSLTSVFAILQLVVIIVAIKQGVMNFDTDKNKEKKSFPLSDLDYLKLNKWQKLCYKLEMFFVAIPAWFVRLCKKIGNAFKRFGLWVADECKDIYYTFVNGSWKTRVSFLVMGFGNLAAGQVLRGLLFLLMQGAFVFYMVFVGGNMLAKFGTLGTEVTHEEIRDVLGEQVPVTVYGDNSFKILLYGLITICLILALVYTWRLQVKQCRIIDGIRASGKKLRSNREDLKSLVDDEFHKTLLSLPIFGIVMFTILPIIFMILVAFTNYDYLHTGYNNLFTWVGLDNFNEIITFGSGLSTTFGEVLAWTLIWAFFATFSNYFLGMFVAMMINKKGIKIKKVWRTILVMTIAIPQFISLLYVSNLFADNGIVNATLISWGIIQNPISFWGDGTLAKIMVLLINIWVGIPYFMLITTGILMNIPEDLYESSKIDGANGFQQFAKITLPYMLFVTGPYLLTSFVGNINNFNVIYLLTQGGPSRYDWGQTGGYIAGDTTILITWLFGITTGSEANYKMASVIGILIFVVVSVLSLIVFSIMPSTRREDDYS